VQVIQALAAAAGESDPCADIILPADAPKPKFRIMAAAASYRESLYQLALSPSSYICNGPGYYAGKGIEWLGEKGLISIQNATMWVQFRKPGAVLSVFRMDPDKKILLNSNYPTPTPTTTASSANLVSQLQDLLPLPKHVNFHVNLIIHQLQHAPYRCGNFRMKWKFKDLQAVDKNGRPMGFGRALASKLDRNPNGKKKGGTGGIPDNFRGKGKEQASDEAPSGSTSTEQAILSDSPEAFMSTPTHFRSSSVGSFDSLDTIPWNSPYGCQILDATAL